MAVSTKVPAKKEADRKRAAREKHHGLGRTGLRAGDTAAPTVVTDHAGVGRGGTARKRKDAKKA